MVGDDTERKGIYEAGGGLVCIAVQRVYDIWSSTEKINFQGQSDGIWTWGDNTFGQLGDGTSINNVPVQSNISNVVAVAAGSQHTVVVKSDETVWAWGYNHYGNLGNGTNANSNISSAVDGRCCHCRCWRTTHGSPEIKRDSLGLGVQ